MAGIIPPVCRGASTRTPAASGAGSGFFLATRLYFHRETRQRRRHHLYESVPQPAVKGAGRRAGLTKHGRRVSSRAGSNTTICLATPKGPSCRSAGFAAAREAPRLHREWQVHIGKDPESGLGSKSVTHPDDFDAVLALLDQVEDELRVIIPRKSFPRADLRAMCRDNAPSASELMGNAVEQPDPADERPIT